MVLLAGGRAGLLLVLLVLVACVPPASPRFNQGTSGEVSVASSRAPEPEKITVSYPTSAGPAAYLSTAKEAGIFAKHGLEVEIVYLPGSRNAVASLIAGETAFADIPGTTGVGAQLSGVDVVILATPVQVHLMSFFALPEIARPEDLRGMKVGVGRRGDFLDRVARMVLRRWGLEPDGDATLVNTGGGQDTLLAMQAGVVAGAPLSPPSTARARQLGYRELLDVGSLGVRYAYHVLVSSRDFVRSRPDTTKRFLRAVIEGMNLVPRDKELSVKAIAKYANIEDPEVAEDYWATYAARLTMPPYPELEGIRAVLQELAADNPAAATARPESLVDPSFVQAIEAEGFIKGLR